jgi:hypothetical protein
VTRWFVLVCAALHTVSARAGGHVRPAVAPSASLRRRPCERDPARRRLLSDPPLRACAHTCRLPLRSPHPPDPGVPMDGRERVSETHAGTESFLTTARLDLSCRRRAVLSKPLLAHPAEIRGVHATSPSHPRNADDRDQRDDKADDKQHMALGAARRLEATCPARDGRRSLRRVSGPLSTTHRRAWRLLLNTRR